MPNCPKGLKNTNPKMKEHFFYMVAKKSTFFLQTTPAVFYTSNPFTFLPEIRGKQSAKKTLAFQSIRFLHAYSSFFRCIQHIVDIFIMTDRHADKNLTDDSLRRTIHQDTSLQCRDKNSQKRNTSATWSF